MNKAIKDLINQQINKEMYSAYLYLDISNFFINKNLSGFGNWYKVQAQEEMDHAMLFMTYLQNNGEEVKLEAIAAPDVPFPDLRAPLQASYDHEKFVTASIDNIYGVALEHKDYRTMQLLSWFIDEQGEEEKNADELIQHFDLFGNDPKSLYLMDKDLAARTYAPPSLVLS